MNRKYKLYQVDAFTKEKFAGNPAGVITNADGLTDIEMQRIARELNNSETAFMFLSPNNDYDVYTRYFSPTQEVPICGHATIASQYVRALELNLKNTRVLNKTGVGILPVDVYFQDGDYQISMTQGDITFGSEIVNRQKEILLKALGIDELNLIDDFKIQIVSTGHSKVMIGLKSIDILNNLNPDMQALTRLSSDIKCNGYYVFTLNNSSDDYLINGRMFAPAIGIPEDPVTGNANGPLGAYLVKHKLVEYNCDEFKFKAIQGEKVNRKGIVEVHVKIQGNEPKQVKVIGNAVIAFKSELLL